MGGGARSAPYKDHQGLLTNLSSITTCGLIVITISTNHGPCHTASIIKALAVSVYLIISMGVLIVGLSRKMRKQGFRISLPVQGSQELSLYIICLYSHS